MHRPVHSHAAAAAVHTAYPHEAAHLHVSGEATYVDDIPELAGTLHAALGLSQHAHALIKSIDFSAVHAAPGVVAVLTAKDIPGENNCGPLAHDDPIFAEGVVHYVGQPVFAVIAQSYDAARHAARQGHDQLRGAAGRAYTAGSQASAVFCRAAPAPQTR